MIELRDQDKIIKYVESKSKDSFPRSLILLGESGSGRHTLVQHIQNKLDLVAIDITKDISFDFIMDIQQRPEPYLYIIEANQLTVKSQNAMLKFIEEPLKNSYIIIIAENSNQLLPTVYNMCQSLVFDPYSKSVLSEFTSNNFILNIAKTPGQVKSMSECNLDEMIELTNKIVMKIGCANIPNILTISDKIAWKKEKDKFDLDIFARVLGYSIREYIKNNSDANTKYFDLWKLYSNWMKDRLAPTVSQKVLFENYLLKFKECLIGVSK